MSVTLNLDESTYGPAVLNILERLDDRVNEAEPLFSLEGRRLEEIIKTLPHYLSSYDQLFQEAKATESWLENYKEKLNARYWKRYLEGYSKVLSARDIQAYIGGEKEIVELNQLIIETVLTKNNKKKK
jgi:hypothetical protein